MMNSIPSALRNRLSRNAWAWALMFICALSLVLGCAVVRPAFAQDGSEGGGYANFIVGGLGEDGFAEPGATLVISIDKFCEGSSVFGPAAEADKLEIAVQAITPTAMCLFESLGSYGSGTATYAVPSDTIYLNLRMFFENADSKTISVEYRIPCVDLTCGDSVQWSFDPLEGALTISGSGSMRDYGSAEEPPWHGFREHVKRLNIQDGITSVGSYAFYGLSNLPKVSFPESMQQIRPHAFQGCGLGFIENSSSTNEFSYIDLPENVDWVCEYAFADCGYLSFVLFEGESVMIDDFAFENCCSSYSEEDDRQLMFLGYANHEAGNVADYAMKNGILFYAVNGDLGSYVLDISGSGVVFKEADDKVLNALFSTLLASGAAKLGAGWVSPDGADDPDSGCDWIDLDADGSPDILRANDADYNTVIKKAKGCNLSGSIAIELSEDDRWQAAMNNKYKPDGFYYGKLIVRFTIIPLTGAKVSVPSSVYSGKPQKPLVTVKLGGRSLEEGVDYTVAYSNNVNAGKNAKVTVTGIGAYSGKVTRAFTIAKASGAFNAKLVKKTQVASSSKKTVIKAKKSFRVTTNKGNGKVTYKKLSGNAKVSISKTGKITVRKGLKRGKVYPIKVKLTCAETGNYKKAAKVLKLKIKVK